MGAFKEPHGGELKQLYLGKAEAEQAKKEALDYQSWDLTDRQLCDIELILNGAFSPLDGFLTQAEYDGVVNEMRLPSGVLWPIPITLDVSEAFAGGVAAGEKIALRDPEGVLIAILDIADIYAPDKAKEAAAVYGKDDSAHPAVHYLHNIAGPVNIGGKIQGVETPSHYDFKLLRDDPAEMRARFEKLGWRRVVAFQTRNPLHES